MCEVRNETRNECEGLFGMHDHPPDLSLCPKCGSRLRNHSVYTCGRDIHDGMLLRAVSCPDQGAYGVRDGRLVLVEPIADALDF